MPVQTQITSYVVIYTTSPRVPHILLRNAKKTVGQLFFAPDGTSLSSDFQAAPSGLVNLNYHLGDFHNIMDLLRNEKPVFLLFNGNGPRFENGLQTGIETVGEGE